MSNDLSKYEVNIRGKSYLTVAGRLALAHQSGRLIGITMYDTLTERGDPEYITVTAVVKVLNEKGVEISERLLKSGTKDNYQFGNALNSLIINEYTGIAKSPREGSPAWQRLPANSPERSNPMEVCATSALGRALGAAGFGDSESFASADEVEVAQNRQSVLSAPPAANKPLEAKVKADRPTASASNPPSDKQKKFLKTLVKEKLNVSKADEFKALVDQRWGKPIEELNAKDVSEWIDELTKAAVASPSTNEDVPF